MIKQNQRFINFLNIVSDAMLVFFSYYAALYLRFRLLHGDVNATFFSKRYACIVAGFSVFVVLLYIALRMYGSYRFKKPGSEIKTVLLVNAVAVLGFMALLYVLRVTEFPRLAVFLFWLFSSGLVILKRWTGRLLLVYFRRRGYNQKHILLVGDSEMAPRYVEEIHSHPQYGCVVQGYLSPRKIDGLDNYCGGYDQLRDILKKHGTDEVVITMQQLPQQHVCDIIALCGRYSVKVSVLPSYNDYIPSMPRVERVGDLKLLNVRSTPDKGPVYAFLKRTADIICSACGLVMASPVMLAVALAIRHCDGGPVIFSQVRVGKNGKEFKMHKFRSMYIDAEQRLSELLQYNEVDGPAFKIENDPRITKVGHFIRRTSIDELPQLVNILRGEMSLVGPRPPLPREVEQYTDRDWGRLAVKPGLTCYWQISGRSALSFDEWMRLDLKYVEEQSLRTDLHILWKTVGVVLRREGAY